MRLRSFSCTGIISSLGILIPRLHVLCDMDEALVSICQLMCKSCVHLHRSCRLCTHGCLPSVRDLDTGGVHHGRNILSDETPRVERPAVPHASYGGGLPPIRPFAAGAHVAAPSVPSPPTVSSPFVILETRQDSSSRNPTMKSILKQGLCVSLVSWKCLWRITVSQ